MKPLDLRVGLESIQHVSLKDALALRFLSKDSPVYKFFQVYMGSSGDDYQENFKLVIYAGSEMIGPSVQVAELAGCITEAMLEAPSRYTKYNPFVFLDIFSGSSSTTIPSVSRFKGQNDRYIEIRRVDSCRPDDKEDYLQMMFRNCPNILFPEYQKSDVFKEITDGRPDRIFPRKKGSIDLCVADPPHYMTLDFLSGKGQGVVTSDGGGLRQNGHLFRSVGDLLRDKVKVFIIYYAHKEQKRLCERVRFELSRYYQFVYRVIVGSEEMAVCCKDDTLKHQIKSGLRGFETLYRKRYDDKKHGLQIYNEQSYPRLKMEESC